MYFSKLLLKTDRETASFTGNPYKVHQELRKTIEKPSKILYRIEYGLNPFILVYSEYEPEWSPDISRWLTKSFTKEFNPSVKSGEVYRFYLRANPTLNRDRKRIPLKREDSLHSWLERKAEDAGFRIPEGGYLISNTRNYHSYKKGEKRITHYGADIEGMLHVVDKDSFNGALENGIGRGKGFGFGMLTIARA